MRWDRLFDDLEGQLEQELSAEELDRTAEEERLRLGRLSLRDRLLAVHERAAGGDYSVAVQLGSGEPLTLQPSSFGRDWFAADLVDGAPRRTAAAGVQCIVPLAAVGALLLTRAQVEASLTPLATDTGPRSLSARLTLPFVLRDLCRRRAGVDLRTSTGDVHGTIDRVGRDHLDLAVHEAGRPRRASAVVQYRVVPLDQLLLVRL
jgi:hypothetical protein